MAQPTDEKMFFFFNLSRIKSAEWKWDESGMVPVKGSTGRKRRMGVKLVLPVRKRVPDPKDRITQDFHACQDCKR